MKTLIFGDTHLLGSVIFKLMDEIIDREKIERIVLIGDYFDRYQQTSNDALYINEAALLKSWITKHREASREVFCLLGNHDIPYIINKPRHYSNRSSEVQTTIKETLFEIGCQLCIEIDGYLVSHAGLVQDNELEPWYFNNLEDLPEIIEALSELENKAGFIRGGLSRFGSIVWADYRELLIYYNPNYPKQIVGHTPILQIDINQSLIGIDTFGVDFNLEPIGNHEVLVVDDGVLKVIKTDFANALKSYLGEKHEEK